MFLISWFRFLKDLNSLNLLPDSKSRQRQSRKDQNTSKIRAHAKQKTRKQNASHKKQSFGSETPERQQQSSLCQAKNRSKRGFRLEGHLVMKNMVEGRMVHLASKKRFGREKTFMAMKRLSWPWKCEKPPCDREIAWWQCSCENNKTLILSVLVQAQTAHPNDLVFYSFELCSSTTSEVVVFFLILISAFGWMFPEHISPSCISKVWIDVFGVGFSGIDI